MITSAKPPHPRVRLAAALLATLLLLGAAAAQSATTRIVVVPLQGPVELAPWQIGIAAGLQRSLNVVDNVFVPPIGDPLVLADRAADVGGDAPQELLQRFRADALLGGSIASAPGGLDLTLERLGPDGAGASRTITVPADPAAAMPQAVALATELLELAPSEADARAAQAVAAEAPPLEVLQPAALAASRLPGADVATLRNAAQVASTSSWVLAELARAESIEGNHDEAVAAALAATEARSADIEALTVLGIARLRAGDAAGAEQAFRSALERNPAHAVARSGVAGLSSGADAIREYERVLDAYPRLLEAHLGLADLLGGARGLQQLRGATEVLPDALGLHTAIVQRALAAGDGAGALAYLRDAAARPLSRTPDLYALASLLTDGRHDAALAFVREGREAFPADAELAATEASLLLDAGDAAGAEAVLRPLHEQAPDAPHVANALALSLVAQDRTDEAREVLAGAADGDATVRFNLAQALLEAGRAGAAVEELRDDMTDAQDDPEAWATYGLALAASGDVEQARTVFARALEIDPEQDLAQRGLRRLDERVRVAGEQASTPLPPEAQAPFEEGMTLLEGGRFGEAVAAFQQALAAAPERPLVSFYLGTALQRDGRIAAALDAYEPALAAFPDSGTVLNNVGFAQLQHGRYDLALPRLRDAVAVAPENARAHLNLGLTYYGLSRFEEALAAWDEATALDPALEPSIRDVRERARANAGAAAE